jgi:hypothetical protein
MTTIDPSKWRQEAAEDPVNGLGEYPSDVELMRIEHWPAEADWDALMAYLQVRWRWPDYFVVWGTRRRDCKTCTLKRRYSVSTGGWSGHESMLASLESNVDHFWLFCWYSSRRGGHYEFRVPPRDIR